jgi:hypothetical protein
LFLSFFLLVFPSFFFEYFSLHLFFPFFFWVAPFFLFLFFCYFIFLSFPSAQWRPFLL